MAFDALSEPQVRFAFATGAASLGAAVLVSLQVIWLRARLALQERRSAQFVNIWKPLMIDAIAGDTVSPPPLLPHQRRSFVQLWVHFQETLRGSAKKSLNQLFAQVQLQSYVHKLLAGGAMDARLLAVTALGHLGDRSEWATLVGLLRHPSPALSLVAARALFMIDASRAAEPVVATIMVRRDWPHTRLANVLREPSPEFIRIYIQRMEQAANEGAPYLPRLVRLFETFSHNRLPACLRQILANSQDLHLVPICLRLVRDPQDLDLVRQRLHDPHWQIQVQAVTQLGRLGSPDDVPALLQLLSSPEWWVRYRAARALQDLPHMDPAQLQALGAGLDDAFARDMVTHVLAEKART